MNIKSGLNWHVYPVNDVKQHITESEEVCWCNPTIHHEDSGVFVIVHHALDGRESREQHLQTN